VKIRNKITLWITGAGLLAGLIFSFVISHELVEQPFELLDKDLENHAYTLLIGLSPQNDSLSSPSNTTILHSLGTLYWAKVFDQQHKLIYTSSMAHLVTLPVKKRKSRYNVTVAIPQGIDGFKQGKHNKTPFRMRVFTIPFGDQEYLIQIAKPMQHLQKEINEVFIAIGVGLVFFTLTLILLGYFVAGKILQPITTINTLAREINDKTLDKRIPLGKNKDELYTLSSSLNQMFDRLQFSFKRQKEFIANASHELKTPIAMQRLFFDEAVQQDDLPDTFRRKLAIQSGVTLRMNQLVKNLLDLSALEQNEGFNPEIINLTELATSVFEEFDEIIQDAGIHLSLEMKETIHLPADKEKIRRVLINLIDNAIKYTLKENGQIRFSLGRIDTNVKMEISNTAQAIPENELGQVFNQFYRVEKSRSTALGGSGLGLTIVKRIIELHYGTIEITSDSELDDWIHLKILLPGS
jgi:signal transduction histidine kinase